MHLAHPSVTKDRGIRAVGPSPKRGAPSWEHIGALPSLGDSHHAVSLAVAEDVGGKKEHLSSDRYAPASALGNRHLSGFLPKSCRCF